MARLMTSGIVKATRDDPSGEMGNPQRSSKAYIHRVYAMKRVQRLNGSGGEQKVSLKI